WRGNRPYSRPRPLSRPRADCTELRADLAPALHQFEVRLEPKEKSVRHLEIARQTQIGVGGYRSFAQHDLVDAPWGHTNRVGQSRLRHPHWLEKLLEQDFSRMGVGKLNGSR